MKNSICLKAAKDSGLKNEEIKELYSMSLEAAKIGGEVLMNNYGDISNIKNKSTVGDLVTNVDIESENKIVDYLKKKNSKINIVAEESNKKIIKEGLNWYIDPLDGTTNYAHGFPFFATSVGLCWNDQPMLGSISVPFFKEVFSAAPGLGAFCNKIPIKISNTKQLVNSLLVTGFAYDRHKVQDNNYSEFCWLTHKTRGVRRAGAAAVDLAFVAKGRLDGYWERGLSQWDMAAGVPLVEIAGGIVSNYPTGEFELSSGRILACTPGIEDELLIELKKVKPMEKKYYAE
tara:strand:+ start:37345 stop:38208 length:864 start_codon:yes stop_codon:yes gene_type:complete